MVIREAGDDHRPIDGQGHEDQEEHPERTDHLQIPPKTPLFPGVVNIERIDYVYLEYFIISVGSYLFCGL